MSTQPQTVMPETPKAAARRLTESVLGRNFSPEALHEYRDAKGNPIYWRIRARTKAGEKWMRPMSFNGTSYQHGGPKTPAFKQNKPLYRLPEITNSPNATVWVVEGEWCVEKLEEVGLLATTSGSSTSVHSTDWQPLAKRNIIIWPDNDPEGENYAREVTRQLQAIGCQVKCIDVGKLDLPPKGDCVDWLKANPKATREQIEALPISSFSNFSNTEWPKPKPLQRQLAPATPFSIDALGPTLAPAVKQATEIIQAPLALCGNSFLAGATLAVQGHANVELDGRIYPLSEFFLTVALSGERKSATDKQALAPHRKYERALQEQYEFKLIEYQRDLLAYEKARNELLGDKTNYGGLEGKKRALQELGDPPEAPLLPVLIFEEPTYEGLIKLLKTGQPSVGMFTDEGGRFIGGHGMNQENILKTAAGLCELWDGKPVTRIRSGDDVIYLLGRRVSFHLMAQPQVAQMMLSNTLLINQGLLSRCLTTWPDSTAGTRFYKEVDLSSEQEMKAYFARVTQILEKPLPIRDGSANELNPRLISVDTDAKKLWIRFHDENERNLAPGGSLESIRGFASKGPEHAIRLAGILALFDDVDCGSIDRDHMAAGIKLSIHYLNEALRLYEADADDPILTLAKKLKDWLRQKHRGRRVTLPEVYQYGPNPIRNARTARQLMSVLAEHGEVRPPDDETRDTWEVRP